MLNNTFLNLRWIILVISSINMQDYSDWFRVAAFLPVEFSVNFLFHYLQFPLYSGIIALYLGLIIFNGLIFMNNIIFLRNTKFEIHFEQSL